MIVRAALCLVLPLSCLLGATTAWAEGSPVGAGAPAMRRPPDLSLFVRRAPSAPTQGTPWLTTPRGGERGSSRRQPVCAGDVCQPRVAVPGLEPSFRSGSRTDAVLAMLSGSPFHTVSRLARAVANVRVDYSPANEERGDRGWGKVVLSLRWRIDASGAPAQ